MQNSCYTKFLFDAKITFELKLPSLKRLHKDKTDERRNNESNNDSHSSSYKRRIVLAHTGKKTRAMSKRKNDMLRVNESATRFKVIESSESLLNEVPSLPSPFPPFLLFRSSVSFPFRWFHPFTLISFEVNACIFEIASAAGSCENSSLTAKCTRGK